MSGATYTNQLLKLLIVGNSGVGKSCLLMRYAENTFTTTFYCTVGVDFKMKSITLDGKKVRLQIWDTAGQETFRTIVSSYYKNAHAVMLVYDITDRESFEALKFWQQEAEKYGSGDMGMMVIGNKLDKEVDRKVTFEEAKEFAVSNKLEYIEVSAMSDKNISEAFEAVARLAIEKLKETSPEKQKSTQGRKLNEDDTTSRGPSDVTKGCSC